MHAEEPPTRRVTVAEVMRSRFMMVDGMNTIRDVLLLLHAEPAHSLIVYKRHDTDEYGILLVGDIGRKVLATGRRPERINVYEVMAKPAITVPASMDIAACARLFERCGIGRAPVVDDGGRIVGIVGLHDMVLRGLMPRMERAPGSGHGEAAAVAAQQDHQEGPEQHPDD
ncbi:MAG: CBS domain-containing protein [Gammaproteobacteria bacterium]|nr:CBS domain-containing protein [Gammaproteobacteria bacterium]